LHSLSRFGEEGGHDPRIDFRAFDLQHVRRTPNDLKAAFGLSTEQPAS
jgi:hypothetical protein